MEYTEIIEVKDRQQSNNWFAAIVIVLIVIAIAYIWQRNNCTKIEEAKELGTLKARTSYDHEMLTILGSRQRQDEEFGFWVRPNHAYPAHYDNGCGYGHGCNTWPTNGCPPYPIPQTKYEKMQRYEAKGAGEITEIATV